MYLYSSYNCIDELRKLISGTTIDEKILIHHGEFDRLWDNVWTGHRPEKYNKFKTRYETLSKVVGMDIIREIVEDSNSVELQWELPKGRKESGNETDLECACREFVEETTLPRNTFRVLLDKNTRCHIKDGNVLYAMKFWGALIKDNTVDPKCSLANKSHHEHDAIKFVKVSSVAKYLPEQMYNTVRVLHRAIKPCLKV